MPDIAVTRTYDAVFATSIEELVKTLFDAVTKKVAVLNRLRERGNIITVDGGPQIHIPVMFAFATGAKALGDYEALTIERQGGITRGVYDWAQYGAPVVLSEKERRDNAGNHKMIDLARAKFEQVSRTLEDVIAADLFNTAQGTNEILPIRVSVASDPTSGTVAGIDRATNTWWRNVTVTAPGSFDVNGRRQLTKTYNDASRGQDLDMPDLIVCAQDVYQFMENSQLAREQYAQVQRLAEPGTVTMGYGGLKFMRADVIWDSKVQSGAQYLLNTKFMKLHVDRERNFRAGPTIEAQDRFVTVRKIDVQLQLCFYDMLRQAQISGWTE